MLAVYMTHMDIYYQPFTNRHFSIIYGHCFDWTNILLFGFLAGKMAIGNSIRMSYLESIHGSIGDGMLNGGYRVFFHGSGFHYC